jgi:hypothetical protein
VNAIRLEGEWHSTTIAGKFDTATRLEGMMPGTLVTGALRTTSAAVPTSSLARARERWRIRANRASALAGDLARLVGMGGQHVRRLSELPAPGIVESTSIARIAPPPPHAPQNNCVVDS